MLAELEIQNSGREHQSRCASTTVSRPPAVAMFFAFPVYQKRSHSTTDRLSLGSLVMQVKISNASQEQAHRGWAEQAAVQSQPNLV